MSDAAAIAARARVARAIVIMVVAMSFVAVVDAIAKYLGHGLPPLLVTWGYFLGILVSLTGYLIVRGRSLPRVARARRPGLQVVRALCLVLSLSFLFTGLPLLPLADATTISFTSPLFVVALSGPLLGERIGPHRWGAVLVGLIGAVIVIRPGTDMFQAAALLPLCGALFFAGFQIVTRKVSTHDDKMTTLLWTAGGGTLMLAVTLPFVWQTPTGWELLVFAVMGLLGLGAHLSMVHAFELGDASMLAPFNYTRIVWALALGVVMFGQFPDAWTLLGGAVIVVSGLYVLYRETRRAPARVASLP